WQGGAEWGKPRAKTREFLGYSSMVIRLSRIFAQSVKSQGFSGRNAALFYLTGSDNSPQLVASSSKALAPQSEQGWLAERRGQSDLEFAGTKWRVTILPSGLNGGVAGGGLFPWLILVFSISLAAAVLLHSRTVHNQQRELQESEKQFRTLVEASPAGMLLVDSAGKIVLSNAQFEKDSGYDSGELAGQLVERLVPSRSAHAHAGHRQSYLAAPTAQPMLGRPDLTVRRKDGSEFYAQIGLSPVQTGSERQTLVSVSNLTERRRFEEHFRESQKLEALGQLTGGLAHDFNNLLGIVIGNLDLIGEKLPQGDEKLLERHRTALEAALHGAEVTHALLAVARRQPLKVQVSDLNALVVEMLALVKSSAGAAVTVHSQLCEGALAAKVDAAGLSSALLNLVSNARDAMENMTGERSLVLRTRRAQGSEAQLEGGEYAVLEVTDNGPGMSEAVKDRAFEPFFTTKALERGTGLGLSMVRGFCEQLGGTARIDSEPGRGTTVRLYLPVQASAQA
ncbi:MAG: ATP-binding protein, partial [Quisquiliibacterium sp.]